MLIISEKLTKKFYRNYLQWASGEIGLAAGNAQDNQKGFRKFFAGQLKWEKVLVTDYSDIQ